jgi:hypothetical protein
VSDTVPWAEVAALARFAPTPHNTQPFRIRPLGPARAELVLLSERLLPREDHGNLYVASSFGVFASVLERAGRHFGLDLRVNRVPDLDTATLHERGPSVVLGEAHVAGRVAPEPASDILTARRTSRLPYHDRPIAPAELAALARVAAEGGHRFVEYGADDIVGPLLRLNAEAIIDNLALDDEREEIQGWYRYGQTPEFGDGLWQVPLNQPAWELRAAFATPRLYQVPGFRGFAIRRYLRTQKGTRHVALVCGKFATWPELYAAGRLLLELWLEMAKFGIYKQPMGSMLTNPRYVAEIARRVSGSDCWLVVRLGYSDEPPRAPRLESILLP